MREDLRHSTERVTRTDLPLEPWTEDELNDIMQAVTGHITIGVDQEGNPYAELLIPKHPS